MNPHFLQFLIEARARGIDPYGPPPPDSYAPPPPGPYGLPPRKAPLPGTFGQQEVPLPGSVLGVQESKIS